MSYTSPFSSGSAAGRTSAKLGGGDHINFCINPILFEHCDLIGVPTGLSPSAILKVHQESSTASSITLSSWKDLAVRVLSLTETAAYSVFDLYFAISGGCMQAAPSFATAPNLRPIAEYRQESSRALLNKMGGRVNEGLWSAASSSRMVSLPGLLLFLYAQHFLARLNATNANNLGGRTSKEADANSTANNNHEKISENLRQYLHDFISIVAVTRPGRVTLSDALELRLLFREFSAGVEQPFGTGIGFLWSAADKSIDVSVLMQFMRSRMVVPGSELLVGGLRGSSTTRFANNVVVQGLRDQYYQAPSPLLSEAMMQLPSSSYTIHNCTQSRIYAAAALPHTKLSALTNCTVAMGPVGGILFIHRCHNCSISALCGALIVSECTNVDLFICVNTPPVLLRAGDGGLSSVRLAPYNTFYPTLEEDLLASGINPCLNLWNAGLPSQNYVLRPADFRALTFPATAGSSNNNNNGGGGGGGAATTATRSNPCNLPEAYRRELEQRVGRFQDISQDLRDAYRRLEDEGRKDLADGLRHKVHSMFLEWLHHSGQGSGLIDILHGSTNTTSST